LKPHNTQKAQNLLNNNNTKRVKSASSSVKPARVIIPGAKHRPTFQQTKELHVTNT